jgi:hypothetical protein
LLFSSLTAFASVRKKVGFSNHCTYVMTIKDNGATYKANVSGKSAEIHIFYKYTLSKAACLKEMMQYSLH